MRYPTQLTFVMSTIALVAVAANFSGADVEISAKPTAATSSQLTVDKIETREITIRDSRGRSRATLGVDGGDVLRFVASSDEHEALWISVFPDGRAAILLRDHRGVNRVAISTREDGRPLITMHEDANILLRDARGRNRIVIGSDKEGEPHVRLNKTDFEPNLAQ